MFARLEGRALGLAVIAALTAAAPLRASAQTVAGEPFVFTLAGSVAGPLNGDDHFGVGGGGSIGVYYPFAPWLLMGARVGGGGLSGGGPTVQDRVDRGALDWLDVTVSARVRPLAGMMDTDRRASGLFVDVGAGPWLVDGWMDPVLDTRIGYGIPLGPVVLSPVVGLTTIFEVHDRYDDDALLIGTGGLELAWGDRLPPPIEETGAPKPPEAPEEPAAPEPTAPEPTASAQPPSEPAPPPPEEAPQPFVNDQLVIDERVFFDYDRWELRPAGIAQLQEVARRYEESGDRWAALVVSGHADRRGPPDYNVDLSRKRADAVRTFLTSHGVPGEILEIQAWGEARPEIPDAHTEYEHQVNRRVQFEIVWREGMRPEGEAPETTPPEPDYVDPAPPDRRDLP